MKKKFILFPLVAILFYVVLTSYSEGPGGWAGLELTGVTGTTGCTTGSCHASSATPSTGISIQLFNGATPVTNYAGGQSLTIRITGTNGGSTTLSKFGFQLTSVLAATTTNAGTLGTTTGTHIVTVAGVSVAEHFNVALPATTGGGAPGVSTYVVNIPWTAPSSGSGNVTLRSVINLVNFNSAADPGDLWNNTSLAVPELGPITGTATVCQSSTTTLSNAFGGGTWSTSGINASVGPTGIVSGIATGTQTITYTAGGNFVTRVVTINANPSATIGGSLSVCQGQSTTLTNSVGGGTWSSASPNVSVTGTSGTATVTGVNAGNAIITYAIGTCSVTATATVNPLAANTGTLTVCETGTTLLSNINTGGTWSSSVPAAGTVNGTGLVTGIAAGTTNITYSLSTGCNSVSQVTVNAQPSAIGGPTAVCIGATITATNSVTPGTWSSSSITGTASIDPSTGIISPSASGSVNITYTATGGCTSTEIITVNPLPSGILGGFTPVCAGSTITLTSSPTTGTWTSGSPGVATIGSTGIVTGVSVTGGTSIISYTLPTGCKRGTTVSVNGLSPVTGTLTLCPGQTTSLSSGPGGGTWSGSVAGVGSVAATTGLFTAGASGGTVTVTYTTASTPACVANAVVTVGALSPITGGGAVCVGSSLSLNDATTGGTWSSSNGAVGTIGSTSGILAGLSTGTTIISYTTGTCATGTIVTVNAAPGLVTGAGGGTFCNSTIITASGGTGGTIYFQGTTSGGTSTATPSSSQSVSSSGTYYFRVQSSLGCWGSEAAIIVSINPSPAAITGTGTVCTGLTTTLNSTTAGGTWGSSNAGIASVGSSSGVVTGVSTTAATATITYTAAGCNTTTVVSVNPLPADYTPAPLCVGATATLSTTPIAGTWLSGNTGVATIGSSSGLVTAMGAGTSNITYTLSTGCVLVKVQSVNPVPNPITGVASVCILATTTLNSTTASGTWTSSDASKATIGSGTGIVTGVAAGTAIISYTLSTGCMATTVATVNQLPTSITSAAFVICQGTTTTLNSTPALGTWSSGGIPVATVGSSSGIVTGVSGGIAPITYTLSTGCTTSTSVTVNPTPPTISGGNVAICVGGSVTLTDGTSGGTWSSGSTAVSVVGSTGAVTGVSPGIATITYTLGTGCFNTTIVSVNITPSAITGTFTVCQGANTTLGSTPATGTWSSTATGFATVGSSSAIVTGISPGTSTISYTLGNGCSKNVIVTVNANPAAITGTASTCVGSTTTLSTISTGGTWISANSGTATVGSGSGIVTGVAVNTVNISYTFSTGCFALTAVTVTAAPSAGTITGSASVCTGLTINMSDLVTGGTWTTSNGNATVGSSSGVVTGVTAGLTTITYTVVTPCGTVFTTKNISVTNTATAGSITGPSTVCLSSNITLSSTVTGGTWVSSNTSVAPIGSLSGIVTGSTVGTSNITYTLVSGCGTASVTATMTVNALPATSAGTPTVCIGNTTTLTNVSGTWASSNTGVATVGSSSGIVTGVTAATAGITFTQNSTGCTTATVVTVNPLPTAFGGLLAICSGNSTTLTSTPTTGTWLSGTPSVALIASGSGLVTGLLPGTSAITYTLATTGCTLTEVLTVNPTPTAITGSANICLGSPATLSSTPTGGTWNSSSTAVATIDAAGLLSGVTPGTSIITYTLSTGCKRTIISTVNALPPAIGGTAVMCQGASTTLTNTSPGGTWSSSDVTTATVGATSGTVNGILPGTAIISYTATTGCVRTIPVSVNVLPAAITGTLNVCIGATTVLGETSTGGVWFSGTTSVATVSATGVVTGVTAGTAVISYAFPTSCVSAATVTVNGLPSAITGALNVCEGATTTLSSGPSGGTWASGTTANATIGSSSGIVSGVVVGTSIITYTAPVTGCVRNATVTVNPLPGAITGTLQVCAGATSSLSGTPTGGTWVSGTTANATIGATSGILAGVAAGTSTITYTLATGCASTAIGSVNPLPGITVGTGSVCVASTITLSGSITGGTWSSSSGTTATVGSSSGIVSGISAGTVTITYTLPTSCRSAAVITVNPLPSAGTIAGASSVCAGANTTFTDGVAGGVWSASNGNATVSVIGVVHGVLSGVDTISYTVTTGCGIATTVQPITINPLPVAGTITGVATVCVGTTSTLSDAITGGTWISSNGVIASVGSASGIVTGGATGTATITYTVTNGCGSAPASVVVTVLPVVNAGVISGIDTVCQGDSISLAVTGTGGAWSSSSVTAATVSATGGVTGVSPGSVTISYIVSNACSSDTATHAVSVKSTADCTAGVKVPVTDPAMLKVYPNPNAGSFTVELPAANGRITITISDMLGKVVETRIVDAHTAKVALFNLDKVSPGNYMVKVNAGEQVFRQQVTIW